MKTGYVVRIQDDQWICRDRLIGMTIVKENAMVFRTPKEADLAARTESTGNRSTWRSIERVSFE